jgi:hypothetical protein
MNNMNLNNELLATIRSLMDQIGDLADKDPDQDADQLSPADLRLLAAVCLEARDNFEALDVDLTEGGRLPADWSDATAT